MSTLLFPCGCQFQVEDDKDGVIEQDPLSPLPLHTKIDMYNIPQDCHVTWDLLSSGHTKGVFQLEGNLGRTWARKVKPESLNDLAALISLLRPGCLRNYSGDPPKNMPQHYCDRKHGIDEIDNFGVPELESILKDTYLILLYQESSMQLSVELAGFNEQEADILRKSLGKKDASLMAEVEKGFLDGCAVKAIVSKEKAEMIFEWIKSGARYSFNRCVTPDTLVTKSNGEIVTLDKISIGDYIICPKDDNNDTVVMVTDKFEHGQQEIYEVKLDNDKTIKCTMQHKFMCGDKQMYRLIDIIHYHYLVYTEDGLAEVNKTTLLGRSRTVDIQVDNDNHVYFANGIATSNSHAISYGRLSYWTAFAKAHAPIPFFCSYLKGANWKQDKYKEISELISDAKTMNIAVNVPDLRDLKVDFNIKDRDIFFGLSGVRGLGKSNLKKIITAAHNTTVLLNKPMSDWQWLDYLLYFSPLVSSTVNKSLISSGSLTFLKTDRKRMLYEYEQWKVLTKKEQEWVQNTQYENGTLTLPAYKDLVDILIFGAYPKKEGGACANKNRVEKLESIITVLSSPPTSLFDTPHSIATSETHHMGVALTCVEIDGCVGASDADRTCLDVMNGLDGSIAVSINEVKEIKTKNKKQMAFMVVSDASCTLEDIVVFPDKWKEHSDKLYMGNNVLLTGHISGGFIVDGVWQI